MKSWFNGWWTRISRPPEEVRMPDGSSGVQPGRRPVAVASDTSYPNAYRLAQTGGLAIFDPALRNYEAGFREGDPTFASDVDCRRWHDAREELLEHAIRIVADSEWKDRLMLRGSALMKAWFGDEARPPGDIDWVLLVNGWTSTCDETEQMLDDIARRFTAAGRVGEAVVDPCRVARDAIWTYERADGVRLTFSAEVSDLPPLKVQCDFVFGETLWEPPVSLSMPERDGGVIRLLAASPELSLAWKLEWLLTDAYPQGKDLYDAVMLAEQFPLPQHLLKRLVVRVRESCGLTQDMRKDSEAVEGMWSNLKDIDWATFVREYPWVDPDFDAWVERFKAAVPELWIEESWRM